MKQGEIWHANLNPNKGSEQAGFRPVVIISGNLLNEHLNVVICCPLSSRIKNYKGNLVLQPDAVNKLSVPSEVLTLHIRSLSKERLVTRIGKISQKEVEELKEYLQEILTY